MTQTLYKNWKKYYHVRTNINNNLNLIANSLSLLFRGEPCQKWIDFSSIADIHISGSFRFRTYHILTVTF